MVPLLVPAEKRYLSNLLSYWIYLNGQASRESLRYTKRKISLCGMLFLMRERKIFFQDFLFEEMPVDEQDYPIIDVKMITRDVDIAACTVVSLDTMLRMNKREEWKLLFEKNPIRQYKKVSIHLKRSCFSSKIISK